MSEKITFESINLSAEAEEEKSSAPEKITIPDLKLQTTEFRERFPTDNDFMNFIDDRNEVMCRADGFASELANTISRCPVCHTFGSMSDWLGIAYVEKKDAKSAADLDDNFYGCPYCFLKHFERFAPRVGRIGF